MIIDGHVHIGKALRWHSEGYIEEALGAAEDNGIDRLFCTHFTALLYDMREGNDEIGRMIRRYPDKVLGYCTIPSPFLRAARDEVDRCVETYGMRGLKIYSTSFSDDCAWISVTEKRLYPVIVRAIENGLVILAHCSPEECETLAVRFPEAKLVMAHMGNTGIARGRWGRAIDVAKCYPNVYLDICTSSNDMGFLAQAAGEVGADRIIYGSDWPLFSFEFALERVLQCGGLPDGLSLEQQQKILGGNLAKLLGL